MKLLFCRKCQDMFRLAIEERRHCKCGLTSGQYDENGEKATYSGEYAVPFGIDNNTFIRAIQTQPQRGWGPNFIAFVFARHHDRFKRDDE